MRIALSSYTYTWAVGADGRWPTHPLDAFDLVERAQELAVAVVQVADNLPLDDLSDKRLRELAAFSADCGVGIEVGTRGIDRAHLASYLRIAGILGSPLVRVVVDRGDHHPSLSEARAGLARSETAFRDAGIILAIENHDRYRASELAGLVGDLGDWTGICLDTVNSFGALEGPEVVIATLAPLAVNVHVKDFDVVRLPHSMGFSVEGRPVGGGRLDVSALLSAVRASGREPTAVIELWTPEQPTLAASIELEADWARQSVRYLREECALD